MQVACFYSYAQAKVYQGRSSGGRLIHYAKQSRPFVYNAVFGGTQPNGHPSHISPAIITVQITAAPAAITPLFPASEPAKLPAPPSGWTALLIFPPSGGTSSRSPTCTSQDCSAQFFCSVRIWLPSNCISFQIVPEFPDPT